MSKYTKSSIKTLYDPNDNFIVLGLTGRTGSGCSTVAKILGEKKENLKHSLFNTDNPCNNGQREEKIIYKSFSQNWTPFIIIQVSSIITLMLAEEYSKNKEKVLNFIKKKSPSIIKNQTEEIKKCLDSILESIEKTNEKRNDLKTRLSQEETNRKTKQSKTKLNQNKNEIEDIISLYNKTLPEHNEKIKNLLKEEYTILFQLFGENIRKSGNPLISKQIQNNFFKLAEKINFIIKEIREYQKNIAQPTFIVIDAIRNPLEAYFFQKRYAAFYLLAITCNDHSRKSRLRNLGLNDQKIDEIDKKEYSPHDMDNEETYVTQDIQACLQRADLYIHNEDASSLVSQYTALSNQIIKFVTLIKYPGIINPTSLERCMQIAYTAKLNSGCLSRQVGAVVTDANFSVKSIGWNDVPEGQVSCNLRNRFNLTDGYDGTAFTEFEKNNIEFYEYIKTGHNDYLKIKDTRNISFCFKSEYNKIKKDKNQVHTRALHAEENAFLQLSKYGGIGIQNGFLFTTASPCELCAKKAYQLGIKRIYYIDPYPGISIPHILQGGENNPELLLFTGAIGRAFHKLYSPLIPYKDEINALIS